MKSYTNIERLLQNIKTIRYSIYSVTKYDYMHVLHLIDLKNGLIEKLLQLSALKTGKNKSPICCYNFLNLNTAFFK